VITVMTMSENQGDYDTTSDTEHMEPTPGPWEIDRSPAWEDQITSGDYTVATVHYGMAGKARANARLIAAAGTAASELPDEYDPVAALEELPRLLDALRAIAKADGTRYAGTDALQHVAEKALDAIRTQPETDN
jgi:hypothetical protein